MFIWEGLWWSLTMSRLCLDQSRVWDVPSLWFWTRQRWLLLRKSGGLNDHWRPHKTSRDVSVKDQQRFISIPLSFLHQLSCQTAGRKRVQWIRWRSGVAVHRQKKALNGNEWRSEEEGKEHDWTGAGDEEVWATNSGGGRVHLLSTVGGGEQERGTDAARTRKRQTDKWEKTKEWDRRKKQEEDRRRADWWSALQRKAAKRSRWSAPSLSAGGQRSPSCCAVCAAEGTLNMKHHVQSSETERTRLSLRTQRSLVFYSCFIGWDKTNVSEIRCKIQ